MSSNKPNAWVHRLSPGGVDCLQDIALPNNVIVNGWSAARELLDMNQWHEIREVIKQACYLNDSNYRRAGKGTSSMWRFLKDMVVGDYVVVPYWGGVFYVARITGEAFVEDTEEARARDAVYRRPVEWLNDKKPLPRSSARSGLWARMKSRQTTAVAGEFVDDIENALEMVFSGRIEKGGDLFPEELRRKLVETTLNEIHSGFMNERKFERLIASVLHAMGGKGVKVIRRTDDKGVDLRAEFYTGPILQVIGVQAKYHTKKTETKWLDDFVRGLDEEGINIGWFISSAEFSDDFEEKAAELSEKHDKQIYVIDGSEFAGMVVDYRIDSNRASN